MKAGLLVKGAYTIIREVGRHILRRPVVGVAAAARTPDDRWLLIRRGDSGQWALPGGTLEWGETLESALRRELLEEAGVEQLNVVRLVGVYSRPDRDPRFHAVTVVVEVQVDAPTRQPTNPLEILEVRLFERSALPNELSHNMTPMLEDALVGKSRFE
ncbi:MAG TPA: NUDIX hydrolase [Polyangiaceae bacterium]|nr:NUDIX hydrolase [Polyangiaceae bacterium]